MASATARLRAGRRFSAFLFVVGSAAQSGAQEVAYWSDFGPCNSAGAELVLREVLRIGDAEGEGIIEREAVVLSWSEDVGYFVVDSEARFKVFDHDGRFVRAVGRRGEGPGEFNVVTGVRVAGGQIVALDAGRRTWQFFDLGGEFVAQRSYGFPGAFFVPVGNGRVVVAGMDRRPDFVGYPLHLVDLGEGAPSLHFGAEEPARWKATDPWARATIVGPGSRAGAVWGGKAGIPTVREWSGDGELLRTIEGELPWFPHLDRHPDPRRSEPPGPVLDGLMADADDRLWMLTMLADERWREAMAAPRGVEPGPRRPRHGRGQAPGRLRSRPALPFGSSQVGQSQDPVVRPRRRDDGLCRCRRRSDRAANRRVRNRLVVATPGPPTCALLRRLHWPRSRGSLSSPWRCSRGVAGLGPSA